MLPTAILSTNSSRLRVITARMSTVGVSRTAFASASRSQMLLQTLSEPKGRRGAYLPGPITMVRACTSSFVYALLMITRCIADTGMPDPLPTFTAFASRLAEKHPNLAYLHLCEADDSSAKTSAGVLQSNEPIRKAWGPRPYVTARGHTRESAIKAAEKDDHTLVGFGQGFLANVRFFSNLV